jgi:accessory gene regulator protein AgrB
MDKPWFLPGISMNLWMILDIFCLGLVCVYPLGPGQSQEKKTAVDCCCIPQTSRHGDYLIATL